MPIRTLKPVTSIEKSTILLYANPKVGKSTFASQIPRAAILATEPGWNYLEGNLWMDENENYVIPDWLTLIKATKEVIDAKDRFDTIVLDTLDNAYLWCEQHVCETHGAEYWNDEGLGFGKGVSLITNTFRNYITKITSRGFGVVLISHAVTKNIKTKVGEMTKTTISLPDKARLAIMGMMDLIIFMDQDTTGGVTKNILNIRGEPGVYEAGGRLKLLPKEIVVEDREKMFSSLRDIYEEVTGTKSRSSAEQKPVITKGK